MTARLFTAAGVAVAIVPLPHVFELPPARVAYGPRHFALTSHAVIGEGAQNDDETVYHEITPDGTAAYLLPVSPDQELA